MRALIGLGNPGSKFTHTRHNVGSLFLDYFSKTRSFSVSRSSFNYEYIFGKINESGFVLVKPHSAVNLSGFAVKKVQTYHKLDLSDMLIVYDDIHLEFGEIKPRLGGGDGGHKGIKSVMHYLDSNKFPRLRIGIGKPKNDQPLLRHVLSPFTGEELKQLEEVFSFGAKIAAEFLENGWQHALNVNSKLINQSKIESGKTDSFTQNNDSSEESGEN